MSVYRYIALSDEFESISIPGPVMEILALLDPIRRGVPCATGWRPIRVNVDATAGGAGDFPSLQEGAVPVFSERALDALGPLIQGRIEALPIVHPNGQYFLINVLDIVDCLDESRSGIV